MTGIQGNAPALSSLSAEQVVALPLETLARSVVGDLMRPGGSTPNISGWLHRVRRDYRQLKDPEALGAISEAVAWLRLRMIIVDDLRPRSEGDWVMLSRQGAQWLRGGPLPLDATG
ncbi:hypothetical protein ACH4ZX_13515 [Streptomyces sp. NPDC020490]|uniref:hypothetical protein n=1 Tax=Streptomyces sp. NPDC020490 TaxID=3365078 RepID=UPI0037A0299D